MKDKFFGDSRFDQAYFSGKHPAGYEDGYEKDILYDDYGCYSSFTRAAKFIRDLGVNDYLEIGCACGYLLEEVLRQGVKIKGWDISEYIVEKASPTVRPFIELKDIDRISELPDKSFDFVHVSTVLGYISENKLDYYLSQIKRITRRYAALYAGTPQDTPEENGIRKINQSDEWWQERFSKFFKAKDLNWYLWEIK